VCKKSKTRAKLEGEKSGRSLPISTIQQLFTTSRNELIQVRMDAEHHRRVTLQRDVASL